jgi:predicted Zn-dependent protease
VPSERLAVALSLTRKMANELDLHPRARRRLGELRRQARISGNDKLLFDVLADKSGRWTEFVLYGNSWTDRLRREGLVV